MRILLDESLPSKLWLEFPEHEVNTIQRRGWAGLKNGALLKVAAEELDVFSPATRISSTSKISPRFQYQ